MRKHRGNLVIRTTLSILLFIFFASSCQTTPKGPDLILGDANSIPLEAGAFAYIIADVPNAIPILNQSGLLKTNTKQLQQMLDKTRSAVIAMYLPPDEKRYRLVSWGNYPVNRAKMALGFSKDWKKQRSKTSGATYWYSVREGLSVALDQGHAWVLSATGNTPLEPFSAGDADFSGTPIPNGFNDLNQGAILSCWLNEPGPFISQKLQEMGLPIEIPAEFIIASVYPVGENQYEALLRIQVPSATQARALVTVLSLARTLLALSVSDGSGNNSIGGSFEILQTIFFANPPVQDDRSLNIKTGKLSSNGIALLFELFSLK
jgi:hypothetical protein